MKEYSITINLTENDLRDLQAKESFDWCFPAIKNDDGTGSNVDKNVLINVKITSGNDKEEE